MEDAAVLQKRLIQLVGTQHDVRAGLAVEAEIPVAVREGVHHGKRRGDLRIPPEGADVDPGVLYGSGQHVAEAVPAHLADKGAAFRELAQHGQHVCGRAAGVCLKKRVALFAQAVLGEVDQQLAECDNVKCLVIHSCSTSYHVMGVVIITRPILIVKREIAPCLPQPLAAFGGGF